MPSDLLVLNSRFLFDGSLTVPGSKSIANRSLLLASLSHGTTNLKNLPQNDDVKYMAQALNQLGLKTHQTDTNFQIEGACGTFPCQNSKLFLGNAGTATRFLTAGLCLATGDFEVDGVERMRERPIAPLIDTLSTLGAKITYQKKRGCLPLKMQTFGILGGKIHLDPSMSSQYLSAILMIAPLAKSDMTLILNSPSVSQPYVEMTLALIKKFGVTIEHDHLQKFEIKAPQKYLSPESLTVEPDASSASYFLAGAAITKSKITIQGYGSKSIQGDAKFADTLQQMGASVTWEDNQVTLQGKTLHGIEIDMNDMPDAAMTLAVTALFAKGKTTIRNIYNWRLKETERLQAVSNELQKLGAEIEEGSDFLVITPPQKIKPAEIETYDDHRMAMAFSLAACHGVPITIQNPHCVSKSFPEFFELFTKFSK